MQIIPAIDLIEGKCVRLTEGDYAQKKIYNEDPLEVAKQFEGAGLMRLHLVDLDGAKAGAVVNWKALEKIANKTNLIIDFGGGIKTEATLKTDLFNGVPENSFAYFVHGYYAGLGTNTIATTDYIQAYSSGLHKDNFYGVQFHPEKSAEVGQQIIQNFLALKS